MTISEQLTADEVRNLLTYCPQTGIFHWKRRPGTSRAIAIWNGRYAGTIAGCPVNGYWKIAIHNRGYRAHRLAWLIVHGEWPEVVDHRDGDGLNNRLSNLRATTQAHNMRNTRLRADNTSGEKGVSFFKPVGRWASRVIVDGKAHHLGYFDELDDAIAVVRAARERLHGVFARHG